ncbi:MAG: P22 coat protein - protein 5 domain protein [Streptomyces sp.]|nr:P22 coat protein - protein 5 domain protein [Streptomyces sp.]
MSVLAFKPEIWSRVILAALQKNLVFGGPGIVNNDYEGEISGPGNVVHITQFGDPVITSYTPNSTLTYQALNDAGLDLNIDQAFSFSFSVDDVDRRQAAGDMQSYLEERASYKLADTADQYIAGLYTGVASSNTVGTSGSPITPALYASSTPADFYQKVLLPLKVQLSQANIPMAGRYVVVPPWAEGLLEQTQAFIAITDMQGQPSEVFQNGMIGRAAGFDIYVSNNAVNYSGSNWIVQAGHSMAITYAEQIVQTEALRLQTTFADGVRGLHVFGAKLVRPDAIAVAYVTRPTGI